MVPINQCKKTGKVWVTDGCTDWNKINCKLEHACALEGDMIEWPWLVYWSKSALDICYTIRHLLLHIW